MDSLYMRGFYKIAEWIMNFAFLNILWILFTLFGFVLFGIFPATVSMFVIVRKWVKGQRDFHIFKNFWDSFKKEFLKSNLLGLILIIIGGILFTDLLFVKGHDDRLIQYIYYPLLFVTSIFILAMLYVFPIYVNFETKLYYIIKNSVLIMIMSPLVTIMKVTFILILYCIFKFIPGLTPLFGASLLAYIIMWSSNLTFRKIARYQSIEDQDLLEKINIVE
ncbi:YesL family protein [Halalkalibacterium halodurans]|uniref:YesL family protein n=1 Tax=Halalkalibacterium halodurans TaxID=86665 RepID=UPI002AAA5DFA|nr:DUF624 domain-containing protein [Halalkalibacterium halodurans]MDY7222665.1 DUF624 domain-containing protein [Halalkalibacterium halodurans]MDY7241886.1 DUF624 domain-containing protein [Halalkalibacterium halodurans]